MANVTAHDIRNIITIMENANAEQELRWLINEQPNAMNKVIDLFLEDGLVEIIFDLDGHMAVDQLQSHRPEEFGLKLDIYDQVEDMSVIADKLASVLDFSHSESGNHANPQLTRINAFIEQARNELTDRFGGVNSDDNESYKYVYGIIRKNITKLREEFIQHI